MSRGCYDKEMEQSLAASDSPTPSEVDDIVFENEDPDLEDAGILFSSRFLSCSIQVPAFPGVADATCFLASGDRCTMVVRKHGTWHETEDIQLMLENLHKIIEKIEAADAERMHVLSHAVFLQRSRQLSFGFKEPSYRKCMQNRGLAEECDARTPRLRADVSRRAWRGQYSEWRRWLHDFDETGPSLQFKDEWGIPNVLPMKHVAKRMRLIEIGVNDPEYSVILEDGRLDRSNSQKMPRVHEPTPQAAWQKKYNAWRNWVHGIFAKSKQQKTKQSEDMDNATATATSRKRATSAEAIERRRKILLDQVMETEGYEQLAKNIFVGPIEKRMRPGISEKITTSQWRLKYNKWSAWVVKTIAKASHWGTKE